MHIKLFQDIIDIVRLKSVKKYLNENPIALRMLLNIFSLFPNHGNELKISLLRYLGASIGNNVGIGDNVYIYLPKNLVLEDYVGIADNTVMRCWNKVQIEKYTFLAINSVFIPGSHNTYDYDNLPDQNIRIGKGCWIGANCTIMGGVNLENGCIVGAGSVLRRGRYERMSIIAGVPAKIIKKRECADIVNQPTLLLPIKYPKEELFNDEI